jgi:acetyltransferase-like isoleucine patch superfamily enzyme
MVVPHLLAGDGSEMSPGDADQADNGCLEDLWKWEVEGYPQILRLHLALREKLKERWQRSIPFSDELFDRWERARFLGFGEGASIYDSSVVLGDVQVGAHTWIGPYTILDGSGGLTIGAWCSISAGVQIYSHDSVAWALTGGQAGYVRVPTSIGDCCYVGPLAIIQKGVTIGTHCVVGANSFVNHDVPDYAIAMGTPCRIVGRVSISQANEVQFLWNEKPEE